MTQSDAPRDGRALIQELFLLTDSMVGQIHDADCLLKGVEDRQRVMDEYDNWVKLNPEAHTALTTDPEIRKTVDKILSHDSAIVKAMENFKQDVQKEVSSTSAQQKVMGYMSNAISSSGSYMDMKLK